jgi:hypothetical protein
VGVRFGKWKLVQYRHRKVKRSRKRGTLNSKVQIDAEPDESQPMPVAKADWRLYNLATDIGETTDVASQHPKVVAEILALLKRDGLL